MIVLVAVLLTLFWGLALLQVIANRLTVRRLEDGEVPPAPPLVSVIIPARDEERTIGATVSSFLAQNWRELEVIVVNDRSTDRTAEVLDELDDPRLHVIEGEEPPTGWLGKPWALQQGALAARGEWLLFCDADVRWKPNALTAVMTATERDGLEAATVLPHLETHSFWERILLVNLIFTLWTLFPLWMRRDTAPRHALGGGPGNLVRTQLWRDIGTHAAIHNAVIDDIGLMRRIRKTGRHTGVLRADHLVEIRMYEGLDELMRGFTKNAWYATGASFLGAALAGLITFVFNVLPYLIILDAVIDFVRGEPFGPAFFWSLATVSLISLARLIVLLPGGYGFWNALLGHPLMMTGWLVIFLRSSLLTGASRRLHWRGREFDGTLATPFGTAYDSHHVRIAPD